MKNLLNDLARITFLLCVLGLVGYGALQGVMAQPLPAVGDQYLEFRATATTNAAFYPSAAALTSKGYVLCVKNDDDADSLFVRTDGTAADATEANCNTVGCRGMKILPGEYVCREMIVSRLSIDASGNAPFRAWVGQRGGL